MMFTPSVWPTASQLPRKGGAFGAKDSHGHVTTLGGV